jgi:DNA polymerase-3 subunit delta
MLIFLYGADNYRLRQKLKEIIIRYKNLEFLNGKNLNFQDFINKIQQPSIFREKKLIILFDFFSNFEIKKRFFEEKKEKFLTEIEDIIVFYEEKEISKKDAFFIFLKNQAKCQEFKLLNREKLKNWIEKEFGLYHLKISEKAIQALINFVGNNLWQLSNEIKKLVSYKKNQKIEVEDVELLVVPKIEADIFKTIDLIALKNKKRALSFIHKHLKRGDDPLYLFSMINFQFRNLLLMRSQFMNNIQVFRTDELSKKLGIHPYVIKKTMGQIKRFSFEELKKIYQKLFQTDLDIKTGKVNPIIALNMLIVEI